MSCPIALKYMPDERRSATRFVTVNLGVLDRESGIPLGYMVNLSLGGMLISSELELEPDQIYSLRIPFDKAIDGVVNFDVVARCVWSGKFTGKTTYSNGFEFVKVSDSQSRFIMRIIELFGPRTMPLQKKDTEAQQ